jgi:hypothetical protein
MDYLKIVSRAWEMVRTNRFLWWLGLLAAFTEGGTVSSRMYNMPNKDDAQTMDPQTKQITESVINWLIAHEAQIMILALVIISILVVLAYLSYAARAGLILSADTLEHKKEKTSFKQAYNKGQNFVWRLWGFNLLLSLILVFLVIVALMGGIIVGLIVYLASPVAGLVVGILLALIVLAAIIIVAIFVTLMQEMAHRMIVLKGEGVFEALSQSKELVQAQFKPLSVSWLIMVGIGFIYAIVALIALVISILIVVLVGVVFGLASEVIGIFAAVFIGLLLLVAASVIGGMYTAFRSAYWTLVYRAIDYLHHHKKES